MELVKALTEISSLIARSYTEGELLSCLVERTCYETCSDLSVLFSVNRDKRFIPHLASHREPEEYSFPGNGEIADFLNECEEYIVSHRGKEGPFSDLLIRGGMRSAAAFSLRMDGETVFLLILNSAKDLYYNQDKLIFLESSCRIAQEALSRITGQK